MSGGPPKGRGDPARRAYTTPVDALDVEPAHACALANLAGSQWDTLGALHARGGTS
jgi:hypothetical protein